MAAHNGNRKRVSFACILVTDSWAAAGRDSADLHNEWHDPSEMFACSHNHLVHQTVDSLHLELELPFVARYRVVHYLWQQCYRVAAPEDIAAALRCRPSSVVLDADDDAEENAEDATISSASLQMMDGFSLCWLATLARSALALHPFSRQLDPVVRPILAFLQRTCTLHLSRRQNNLIALLPKLMEIIIILCGQLERGARLRRNRKQANDHDLHNGRYGGDQCLSRSYYRIDFTSDNPYGTEAIGFANRCGWWLSSLGGRNNIRAHRLFSYVRKLLLQPGPVCFVKAAYLQHIAHRFFPQLPSIQRPPAPAGDGDVETSGASSDTHAQNDVRTAHVADSLLGSAFIPEGKREEWRNG